MQGAAYTFADVPKWQRAKGEESVRIGIITFQRAENFGAALQCRALYCYLKDQGHDVEIIDYKNESLESGYSIFPKLRKNLIKLALRDLYIAFNLKAFKSRREKFKEFIAYLPMTERLSGESIKENGLEYDLIIAGSDQIWNPKFAKGFNEIYFLQFPGDFIRATYAVSAGTAEFLRSQNAHIDEYVKTFDYIAVREKILAEYIERNLKRKIPQTLDPTLLYDMEWWTAMTSSAHVKVPEKYILMYNVKPTKELKDIAAKLSRDYDAPVIHVNPGWDIRLKMSSAGAIGAIDVGPAEFVYLIKNASKVATSSFHGAVFSCIFRKDVYIYIPEEGGDARLEELAGMFGIQDRVCGSYKDFCEKQSAGQEIVYDTRIYEQLRAESIRYLDEITHQRAKGAGKDRT